MSAELLFVQFSDGSTWGDTDVANELFWARPREWRKLKFLMQTYESEGEQAFIAELRKQDFSLCVPYMLRQDYERNPTAPSEAIKELADMLHSAEDHQASMLRTPNQ